MTDIPLIIREGQPGRFAPRNPPNVGSYWKDRDMLADNSPINNIDKIKVPILLIHGDKDLSVDIGHSTRMVAALEAAGKDVRFVLLKDGNHHLMLERSRALMLKELDAFLDQHLQ